MIDMSDKGYYTRLPVDCHVFRVPIVNIQHPDIRLCVTHCLHGDHLRPVPARIDGILDATGNACEHTDSH